MVLKLSSGKDLHYIPVSFLNRKDLDLKLVIVKLFSIIIFTIRIVVKIGLYHSLITYSTLRLYFHGIKKKFAKSLSTHSIYSVRIRSSTLH